MRGEDTSIGKNPKDVSFCIKDFIMRKQEKRFAVKSRCLEWESMALSLTNGRRFTKIEITHGGRKRIDA